MGSQTVLEVQKKIQAMLNPDSKLQEKLEDMPILIQTPISSNQEHFGKKSSPRLIVNILFQTSLDLSVPSQEEISKRTCLLCSIGSTLTMEPDFLKPSASHL